MSDYFYKLVHDTSDQKRRDEQVALLNGIRLNLIGALPAHRASAWAFMRYQTRLQEIAALSHLVNKLVNTHSSREAVEIHNAYERGFRDGRRIHRMTVPPDPVKLGVDVTVTYDDHDTHVAALAECRRCRR